MRDEPSPHVDRRDGPGVVLAVGATSGARTVRSVAFLRGINVGGHRVTKDELIAVFTALGLTGVDTFLASGNVLFAPTPPVDGELIGASLEEALGYPVPTTIRSATEVRHIADREPFSTEVISAAGGKPQVILLFTPPAAAQQQRVLDHAYPADRLVFEGRELHWLPRGGISDSALDLNAIAHELGPITVRTANTIARLAERL